MPRKKTAEIEILSPEDDQQPRGRKKLVEAEHTIKYSAPLPVTVEEDSIEDDAQQDFEFAEEEKARRRRKTSKDERDDLRRELDKLGVASVSRLKLSIDKYRHSDSDDSGTLAEKDYCTKYPVLKDHILNDDYMDVARRYGPGRYWFTLRMDNKIVRQWERQVNHTVTPSGPMVQNTNPSDPASPQFIVQMPEGSQQPIAPIDPFKEAEKALSLVEKYNRAFGRFQPQAEANPARNEDDMLASAILKQPEVVESVIGSVLQRFGGKRGNDDDGPSPWAVAMKLVETGQASQIAKTLIDGFFNGFRGLFPGGQNNGQAPLAQTSVQNQTPQGTNQQQRSEFVPGAQGALQQGDLQMGSSQALEGGTSGDVAGDVLGGVQPQMATTPEDAALRTLIDNCMRNVPAQIAFDRLIAYADMLNEQAPQYSIDGYISLFAAMPIEAALEFVKSQPNGEAVASLPHCREWTEQLQQLIKEAGQEGEE